MVPREQRNEGVHFSRANQSLQTQKESDTEKLGSWEATGARWAEGSQPRWAAPREHRRQVHPIPPRALGTAGCHNPAYITTTMLIYHRSIHPASNIT